MRHTKILLICTVLTGVLLPLCVAPQLRGALTTEMQERYRHSLAVVGDIHRESATFQVMDQQAKILLADAHSRVRSLGRRKRLLRKELAEAITDVQRKSQRADAVLQARMKSKISFEKQKRVFADLVRRSASQPVAETGQLGSWILRRLTVASLRQEMLRTQRDHAYLAVQQEMMHRLLLSQETDEQSRVLLHAAAKQRERDVTTLQSDLTVLQDAYLDALRDGDTALMMQHESNNQLARIQQIEAEVQADILALQSEMARIDGRLRVKAERELVQKGLLSDRPDRFSRKQVLGKGDFHMPVTGNITAGYMDASYLKFFGVPHKGVDIAVSHGTSVQAIADGIVYIVRNGGLTGYSYILIGHRDGYASLYGHLSKFSVTPGQRVERGEEIGKSGGTPGTHGAGPMTTGAHLHLEMIRDGQHIDPRTLLQ
jgi:murein DD-endopeptidase MepM/ murein hydrolase activator NlpD